MGLHLMLDFILDLWDESDCMHWVSPSGVGSTMVPSNSSRKFYAAIMADVPFENMVTLLGFLVLLSYYS